jgi:ABC-2 type transport system permease protein
VGSLAAFYARRMQSAALIKAQYRFSAALWLIGLVIEPVIYLVVWTTVAREHGGAINGYTASGFAAYYIVWTFVRITNIGLNPVVFEWRVRGGSWSGLILRPMHPVHEDIAFLAGSKLLDILWLVPVMALLALAFKPDLQPLWWHYPAFLLACLIGFLVRTLWMWVLGLITFWTVRVAAFFELWFAVELLLSGRVVPLDLLPVQAQRLATLLPYRWTFAFPIELMIGRLSPAQIATGFGWQLAWLIGGWIVVQALWKRGVRRYAAAGA